jgi:predicted transcriptional regulator
MPKTLTVRMDEATYRLIEEAAAAENRSVSNFIETAALQKATAEIFVSEGEMSDIRGDAALVKRLKAGRRDAGARRGRFA